MPFYKIYEITLNIYTEVMEDKKIEAINELENIF